jgi:threonine synthase
MLGFQAEGAAPIVHGAPVEHPETVATAIRIGNPASWCYALDARDQSGGSIDAVSDEQILRKMVAEGRADPDACYVAVLTGHGLKDPGLAVEQFETPQPVPADMNAILRWLGW